MAKKMKQSNTPRHKPIKPIKNEIKKCKKNKRKKNMIEKIFEYILHVYCTHSYTLTHYFVPFHTKNLHGDVRNFFCCTYFNRLTESSINVCNLGS